MAEGQEPPAKIRKEDDGSDKEAEETTLGATSVNQTPVCVC